MSGSSIPALVACAANLLLIAALPRFFFRPGRLNLAWWATAAPFLLAGAVVAAALVGVITTPAVPTGARSVLAALATLLSLTSVGLIGFALGSHTRPVSLWHQENDTPTELVTTGAYARIRHPFYAAFQLTLLACVAAVPGIFSAIALAGGVIQLGRTARREERRLTATFGAAYLDYMRKTSRFVPIMPKRCPGGESAEGSTP